MPVQADVRKPEDLKAAAKACIDKFGKLDFVICGTCSDRVPENLTIDRRLFDPPIRCCWKLVRAIVPKSGTRVV